MIAAISLSRDLLDAHELAQSVHGPLFQERVEPYAELLTRIGPTPIEALHRLLKADGDKLAAGDALLLTAAAVELVMRKAKR